MLVINSQIRIPYSEFKFTYARSSGPGGQNVNKVNSKVVLRWSLYRSRSLPDAVRRRFLTTYANKVSELGEVVLQSDRFRDQKKNKEDCVEKLRALLVKVSRPPKKRKKTRPTKASKRRRLESKKRQGDKKKQRQRGSWD